MDPRILKPEPNNIIYGSNKVILLLKKYIRFYILDFYGPILPPRGKIMGPYFREKESSEASGRHPKTRTRQKTRHSGSVTC